MFELIDNRLRKAEVFFKNSEPTDIFEFKRQIYMKISDSQAINLRTKTCSDFNEFDKLEILNVSVKIIS